MWVLINKSSVSDGSKLLETFYRKTLKYLPHGGATGTVRGSLKSVAVEISVTAFDVVAIHAATVAKNGPASVSDFTFTLNLDQ